MSADEAGVVTVTGHTESTDFPTTNGALSPSFQGIQKVFVTRLDPWLLPPQQMLYSTLVGGTSGERAWALAVDAYGFATITGETNSIDFPTTAGAFQPGSLGNDAFVSRLDMLPTGVSAYGTSTPGCAGILPVGVGSWPQVGNTSFLLICRGAPAISFGFLAFGTARVTTPLTIHGVAVWLDPLAPVFSVLVPSNHLGSSYASVPVPGNPALAGLQAFAQHFWLDPCGSAGLSASGGLAIVVQP